MNSITESPTRLEAFQKYVSRFFRFCFGWVPCFQRKHLVHPSNTNAGNNTYFKLESQRRIRVIHIDSNDKVNTNNSQRNKTGNLNINQNYDKPRSNSTTSNTSDSSVDEYWFTRWSRPLRISDDCNCSFRQNWRKSLRGSKRLRTSPQLKDDVHYDTNKEILPLSSDIDPQNDNKLVATDQIHSSHIESFAEDFIQDILNKAISCLAHRPNIIYKLKTSGSNFNSNSNILKQYFTDTIDTSTLIAELEHSNSVPCSSSASSVHQLKNNTRPTIHDSKADSEVSSVHLIYKDNVLNANTGCINPAFLDSASDPDVILNTQFLPRKVCKHIKRITKPLLYFLHGVGSSADIWQSLLNYFVSAGFEVVAPDLLGHGFSSTPDQAAAYTFQRLLKDAVDIFDRFVGEHGRCVVIGHAYGCSLAAAVARYRTQVTHLVLISGGGPTPLAPAHEPALFPCLQSCLKPFIVCGCKRDALYAPCGKHMAPCDALSGGVPKYVLRHVAQGQDWPEGDSTFHRRILVPTLLVHGMRDPHITLVQECEMERTIPRSFLELIPNAGHLSMLETPRQLSHMVHCFIEWWSR